MDWQPISTAPRDGTRVRLAHTHDPSSFREGAIFQTWGEFNGHRWQLNAFFIIPGGRHGLMTDEPTHWLPPRTLDSASPTAGPEGRAGGNHGDGE